MFWLLLRGMIEMVMIEWARMDLEERPTHPNLKIVQVDVWIGGREVLWMWFIRKRSAWKQKMLLRKMKMKIKKGRRERS